jgi:peptidoglycan/xylan/chitin deacetylase (PgdA/CDA1 family)
MNFYDIAYPILKKYKIPATVFVVADKVGQGGYLGWDQMREMSGSGLVTIGSHTKTHPWLPTVSVYEDKLRDEIAGSKAILEKGLGPGASVGYICYPNGAFNGLVEEAARACGYKGGFTTNPTKKSDINDIYAIRRIKMSSSTDNPLLLYGKLSRYYVWFKERR